ncbi:MAG: hypothetical protein M0T84_05780 [Betaproteobacteria bacterium]|nr:hypothetical protein [Betaproteobacteria bacterium]
MPSVHFEFVSRPRLSGYLGWALLIIGILGVGFASIRWRELAQAREAVAWHLMSLPAPQAVAPPPPGTSPEAASLEGVRAHLDASWQPVFAALEAGGSKNVALLSVQVSGRSGRLDIHAQARHLADALAFAARLQRQPALKEVLMTEDKRSHDEGQPLDFHVRGRLNP